MKTIAQFLFFYVDQLIQQHWVDWMEGPLSNVPSAENCDSQGFQKTLGESGSGPRTRAGEAYKLGMLSGRIVKSQSSGLHFPSGWKDVVAGKVPSTKLGYYAYIIGKSLRVNPDDANLQNALDCLACIQILHIGFVSDRRWYSTVLLFRYALQQFEDVKNGGATDDEKRYLAAAVFNTIESDQQALLLTPYIENNKIDSLVFNLNKKGFFRFTLLELSSIVERKKIKINDFNKAKAPLYWSDKSRGIYTRASRSLGVSMLDELLIVDQKLAKEGQQNLLSETLEAIEKNEDTLGIFANADSNFSSYPDLYAKWQDLENELFSVTNSSVEHSDLNGLPKVWFDAQKNIRENQTGSFEKIEQQKRVEAKKPNTLGTTERKTRLKSSGGGKKREIFRPPTQESLSDHIAASFEDIEVQVPLRTRSKKRAPSVPRVTKKNFAEQDARNRDIGEAGEHFVIEYERFRLRLIGRNDLAEKVTWASKDIGDGLGYDIISFSDCGDELLIEVKTTQGGSATPFFLSSNEVVVSRERASQYVLYRVFDFLKSPKLFVLRGALEDLLDLHPVSYRARLG